MACLYAYWHTPPVEADEDSESYYEKQTDTHQGTLTNEHPDCIDGVPVLVEEESDRVYQPGDLPPNTVVFLELAPNEKPEIVELARDAGYRLARA